MFCDGRFPQRTERLSCLALLARRSLGLGLRRGMRMVARGIDVKLADHLLAEAVLRQHSADRATHYFLGSAREQTFERLGPKAAGVSRVAHVFLREQLVPRDADLRGVYDDHRIADVEVRREHGLVLPAQERGDLRGEPPQRRAVR